MAKAKGGTGRGTDKKGWTRWGTKSTVRDNSKDNVVVKGSIGEKGKTKNKVDSKDAHITTANTANNMEFNPKRKE
ncbi:MAG: DUF3934 family protein [Paenibacillaceae bacterium]